MAYNYKHSSSCFPYEAPSRLPLPQRWPVVVVVVVVDELEPEVADLGGGAAYTPPPIERRTSAPGRGPRSPIQRRNHSGALAYLLNGPRPDESLPQTVHHQIWPTTQPAMSSIASPFPAAKRSKTIMMYGWYLTGTSIIPIMDVMPPVGARRE